MFKKSNKPEATITQISDGYYVLSLGDRELGGTSWDRLRRYARAQGYCVRTTPLVKPTRSILSHGL